MVDNEKLCAMELRLRKRRLKANKGYYLPINTDKKNKWIGMLSIGEAMFRNQLGDIGNSLRNNRKKNKLSILSCTCNKRMSRAPIRDDIR